MSSTFSTDLRQDWLCLEAAINCAKRGSPHPVLDGRSLEIPDVVAVARFDDPGLSEPT